MPRPPGASPRPPALRLALAGDTMLGRRVGEALLAGVRPLLDEAVVRTAREADLFLLNLECCISERGARWPDPRKAFFFRAPPRAAEELARWGVHGVTLANNHALDYGADALLDTLEHLDRAGIRHAGGGADVEAARAPALFQVRGARLALVSVTDWPREYAAGAERPGVAYADLRGGELGWLPHALQSAATAADVVLLSPHWGPNWASRPLPGVRAAAAALGSRAALVWGHSAHVPQGIAKNVLFDAGDFLTDFHAPHRSRRVVRIARWAGAELGGLAAAAAEEARRAGLRGLRGALHRRARRLEHLVRRHRLRGDLQLLFLVSLEGGSVRRIEAVPLKLTEAHTRLARPEESKPLRRRFRGACAALGTPVVEEGGRLVVRPPVAA